MSLAERLQLADAEYAEASGATAASSSFTAASMYDTRLECLEMAVKNIAIRMDQDDKKRKN